MNVSRCCACGFVSNGCGEEFNGLGDNWVRDMTLKKAWRSAGTLEEFKLYRGIRRISKEAGKLFRR